MGKVLLAVFLVAQANALLTSPSIESCPSDSTLVSGICKCNPESCTKPPCLSTLVVTNNSSDTPGNCCPTHSCEGCLERDRIHGQCPCADGAILNADDNKCTCVDPEKTIQNGKCECDLDLCKLPEICDQKSVLVSYKRGCCTKTKCEPCPDDSFSTNYNSDTVEDKCVCFQCNHHCEANQTIVVIRKGKGVPGHCCDLYNCENVEGKKTCIVGERIFNDGESWENPDSQLCKCQKGISLCTKIKDNDAFRSCHYEGNLYMHSESWMIDSCTNCTCIDGDPKCIAHWCDTNESRIKKTECQPLINCNKVCHNGFKLNKRGCEICKCNSIRLNSDDILQKYNISKEDLIKILENRKNSLSSTTFSTTTTFTTTISNPIPKNSTTIFISTRSCEDATAKWIYGIVSILFVIFFLTGTLFFFKNYKKKGSYDPVKLKGAINNYVIRN